MGNGRKFIYTSRHAGRHVAPSGQAGTYPLAAGVHVCVRVPVCLCEPIHAARGIGAVGSSGS
eukprot:5481276-Prymnesium_polylepis.1